MTLITELTLAQKELQDLRDEAAKAVETMDSKLRLLLQYEIDRHPSERDFNPEFDLVNHINAEHPALPGYAELLNLVDRLKVARQKVYNLELTKVQILGSPTTFSV